MVGFNGGLGILGKEGSFLKLASGLTCPCDRPDPVPAFQYDQPPEGETRFHGSGQIYRRGYHRCRHCGHWSADIQMDLTDFYRGGYMDGTYGLRMQETFRRILTLPPERSDNTARVHRVLKFAEDLWGKGKSPSLLDVGSGLAVFPLRMREAGWKVTALDPDPRAALHAREQAGVQAIHADFLEYEPGEDDQFDMISMNKVLEHVKNPVAMLARALRWIQSGGVAYLEVPDASAERLGPGREEFFIEHLHVFSPESLRLVIEKSGWTPLQITPLREASGKFTLAGFAKNK